MTSIERRHLLRTTAVGLGTLLAGCIDGEGPNSGEDPSDTDERTTQSTDSRTETPTDEPSATPAAATELIDSEVVPATVGASTPPWYEDDAVGHVTVAATPERAEALVNVSDLPDDRREGVGELLRETDFETSLVALVETVGPDTCYDTVEVSDPELSDGRLVGGATAVDTSDEDTACGQAITFPSALVRATFDGLPPDSATFTITDGWGSTAEETATVDDPVGPDPEDLDGYVRPDSDPIARDPLTCDRKGFERQESWPDDPPWGETTDDGEAAFALRVDTLEAAYGETVTIRLTNLSDTRQGTGNRHKHAIETHTEDGWQSVWGTTDSDHPLGYTDEAIVHYPGEGFEWTLELTEEGLLADHTHADRLAVCPDLEPGRYRFVFWEPDVAVAFDLVE